MSASAAQLDIGYCVPPRAESIDMRWSRFLGEHPHALADFHAIAVELLEAGETRLSAKFIVEIARYQQIIRKTPGARWRIDNCFTSRLARALEATYPALRGKFETRELHDAGDAQA